MTTPVSNLTSLINQVIEDNEIDGSEALKLFQSVSRPEDAAKLDQLIDGILTHSYSVTPAAKAYAVERYYERRDLTLDTYEHNSSSSGLYQCDEKMVYVKWAYCVVPVGSQHILMTKEADDHTALADVAWSTIKRGLPGGTVHVAQKKGEHDESSSCGAARESVEEIGLPVRASSASLTIYDGVVSLHECELMNPVDELILAMLKTEIVKDTTTDNDAFLKIEVRDPREALESCDQGEEGAYGYPEQLPTIIQTLD